MSSLKYLHRYMKWSEQLNYYSFGTRKPEKLSKKQLVSRLYKAFLRVKFDDRFRETTSDQVG